MGPAEVNVVQQNKSVARTRRNRFKKDEARQRARWRGRLWIGCKLVALAAVLLGISTLFMLGYAAVTQADYFRTEAIEVLGNQRLSTGTVLAQAGIRRGENLLGLNLRMVRQRLMDHPWIATARVTREIPDTLVIRVDEHEPLARIDLGRHFLVNRSGRIFKEVEAGDPSDLPLVTGLAFKDISLGEDALSGAMRTVLSVLRFSEQSRGGLHYATLVEVHMDEAMGVVLTLADDRPTVRLGFDAFDIKLERFKRITDHLAQDAQQRRCVAVDLNNPDRVVVRWDSAIQSGS